MIRSDYQRRVMCYDPGFVKMFEYYNRKYLREKNRVTSSMWYVLLMSGVAPPRGGEWTKSGISKAYDWLYIRGHI